MKPNRTDMPLKPKVHKFVEEYLIDMHATNAAIRAGYVQRCAKQVASRLMCDPRVRALVAERMAVRLQRVTIRQDQVVEGLMAEALNADQAGARVRAWELLGKHIGMWPTKVELSGTVTVLHRSQLLERVNAAIAEARAELMPVARA